VFLSHYLQFKRYNCYYFYINVCSSFLWLMNLGRDLPPVKSLKDDGDEAFPSLFARAAKRLSQRLKIELGILFDRPVLVR
jgi:hypothetical protein